MPAESRHTVLDLFAGTCTGWGIAADHLGHTELGVENDRQVIDTRSRNDLLTVAYDAWDFDALLSDLPQPGTILASPPCQTFSASGNGKGYRSLAHLRDLIRNHDYQSLDTLKSVSFAEHDDRIGLALLPLHYTWLLRPEFAVFEQVQPAISLWEAMVPELQIMGYSTWTGILRAEQFGVPQARRRAFLIASRYKAAEPPPITHSKFYQLDRERVDSGVPKWRTMADALGRDDFLVRWPYSASATKKKVGDIGWDWARSGRGSMLRESCYPALTMTSKIPHVLPDIPEARISSSHVPDFARTMTVDEAKALMTYPPDFQFVGGKKSAFRQIGNAVPPLLASQILQHLWRD